MKKNPERRYRFSFQIANKIEFKLINQVAIDLVKIKKINILI
jgi:hypothetical protein